MCDVLLVFLLRLEASSTQGQKVVRVWATVPKLHFAVTETGLCCIA